jgi:hypothetical protein
VVLVRTDVSEENVVSFIRATRIGELGKSLDVTPHKTAFYKENFHGIGHSLAIDIMSDMKIN